MNNIKVLLRWIGNLLIVTGYFILLYNNMKLGLSLKFLGGMLVLPSFIQLKMWDVLMIAGIFSFIEGSKLIQLYFVK
jgi:hypothetical protein